MAKQDKFDQDDQDLTTILPRDLQELGPDEAVGDYDMTDPAIGDVEQILKEIRADISAEGPAPDQPDPSQEQTGEEFRDQEYRDAFDENFERAFQDGGEDVPTGEDVPGQPARRKRRKPRRKPIKKKGNGLLGIPHFLSSLILWGVVVAIGVTMAHVVWLWADDVLALTKEEKMVEVTIADTDTMSQISQKLADAGLVRYPKLFDAYSDITGAREKIGSGTFTLNCMYDYHALVNALGRSSSSRVEVKVTIPEGYECRQIFALLEKNGVCTVEELETAAMEGDFEDFWFLQDWFREEDARSSPNCLEGFLFPDTYNFYTADDPERVLRKMLNNFENRFDEDMEKAVSELNAWLGEKMVANGYSEEEAVDRYLSIRDLVTVASMIERETAGSGESGDIAGVIYNRLCDPDFLYLNIDATIQYALGERKENLSYEDTQIDSPYNTYTHPGLPAGPISNPGLNSLRAALHPEDSTYYYYALDPREGTHHFSETYEEQQAFLESLNNETDTDEP